jgi:hypothetical protein
MTHPFTYGASLAIMIVSNFEILKEHKSKVISYLPTILASVLMVINILLTNSRSPLVFLAISLLGFMNLKNKALKRYLIPFIITLSLSFFVFQDTIIVYFENIYSLANVEKSSVGGSDLFMRMLQLKTTLNFVANRMFFGLGIGSFNETNLIGSGIAGGESVWIQYYLERGIFGVLCYMVFIVFLYKKFRIKNHPTVNRIFFFMITAWVVFSTITGEMSTRVFFITVILIMHQLLTPTANLDKSNPKI